MATSNSEDATSFTFWPDRDKPRPGLRPARGIARRKTTIRPFKIVKDWSSPASSQHDDDDDKTHTPLGSKVPQSCGVPGSPESVVHESPRHGSLPEQEEPPEIDIHDAGSSAHGQRRKSGRVSTSKGRSEWWKTRPEAGSSADKLTLGKALTPPNDTPAKLDSSTTQQKNKKRGSDLSSTAQSDSESVKTTEKKKQQSLQQEVPSSVRNTKKKRQQKLTSFQPDKPELSSLKTTRKKKQQSIESEDSNTVRNTRKRSQQKQADFQPDESDSGSVRTTGRKKRQSIELADSDSSSVPTTQKNKRQRRPSFQPDESDLSSEKKKHQRKENTQALSSTRASGKRRQHCVEPEHSDSSSVRTTGKQKSQRRQRSQPEDSVSGSVTAVGKKRQAQQSFQADESDSSAVMTTGKKKRQRRPSFQADDSDSGSISCVGKKQQEQQSLNETLPTRATSKKRQPTRQRSAKHGSEKTRPSSQRTPDIESNVPSESSMQRTRRVSKSPTEWWKVTGRSGSDSRSGMSSSSVEEENQMGLSSGSSSSSGGYRGMKTPRSQGQGDANNFVSGISRRVISKRPSIPLQHAVADNKTKGQTVYQWSGGGLERNLGDLSDLDVVLTTIYDMTQQYLDASGDLMEPEVCQEMMTQFTDRVVAAIQRKIDIVQKCKFDQSRLRKMDLTIRKRRAELLSLQREDMRLDQQLDQLKEKLTDSTERELTLQKTCTFLKDLQELQQKYMDST
ncbi:uncharacterized protein LOC144862122 isoform X1 [Branchiostoma floridae x Branchiostoma japonicum]